MNALARLRGPDPSALWWGLAINLEVLAVLGYVLLAPVTITDPLVLVYPLVWINVGVWAILRTSPPPAPSRHRRLAGALAVGYFAVLAVAGGLIGPGGGPAGGFHVGWPLPPGWGPALIYAGTPVNLVVVPYKVVGYAALAYLVYATALDAAGSVVSGVVGLFSCVSCTWPVLGTVLTGVFGGSSMIASVATGQPYAASTLVFFSAVALLSWRPLAGVGANPNA